MKMFYLFDEHWPEIRECFFVGAVMFARSADIDKGYEPIRLDCPGGDAEHWPLFECVLFEREEDAKEFLNLTNKA
jgi:hypothetical protein